jgi:hypothetical protein
MGLLGGTIGFKFPSEARSFELESLLLKPSIPSSVLTNPNAFAMAAAAEAPTRTASYAVKNDVVEQYHAKANAGGTMCMALNLVCGVKVTMHSTHANEYFGITIVAAIKDPDRIMASKGPIFAPTCLN